MGKLHGENYTSGQKLQNCSSKIRVQGIGENVDQHRKQLRAGAAARSEVEMLHAEVRVERVAEPHPPAERQPLALGRREGLPVVQLGARLPVTKQPLGTLPPAPTSLSPATSARSAAG